MDVLLLLHRHQPAGRQKVDSNGRADDLLDVTSDNGYFHH